MLMMKEQITKRRWHNEIFVHAWSETYERQKKVKYKCERDEKKVIDIESHFASI